MNQQTETRRAGFVALLGEPNAGKSTLLNRLVGEKVSIVTHKAQTTRSRVRGISCMGETQLIFIDTPGLFVPRRRLDRAMIAAAWSGLADADCAIFLLEAHKGLTDGVRRVLDRLSGHADRKPFAAAINKIDRVKPERLLALAAALGKHRFLDAIFMISARTGDGVDSVAHWAADQLPEGPWLFPEDQVADQTLNTIASEITREKLMLRLHEEIPYQLTVETDSWRDLADGSARISQKIYVMRPNHKAIAIGPGGATIRAVGIAARKDIEELVGRRVHLVLRVKARPNWMNEPGRYEAMGLDYIEKRAFRG